MNEKILLVINGMKNFAKYLVIPTGVVTFLPEKWLDYVRLSDVKSSFGIWISCVFFISLSIVVIDGTSRIVSVIIRKKNLRKKRNSLENSLTTLNKTEKEIIKVIFEKDNAIFDLSDASVSKLESMYIIMRPSASVGYLDFSYCLQPWVSEYLKNNPGYFMEDN